MRLRGVLTGVGALIALALAAPVAASQAAPQQRAAEGAKAPRAAIDSQGRVTVAWERREGPATVIQAAQVGPDGTPGPPLTVSAPFQQGPGFGQPPLVAVDSQGRATILWSSGVGVHYARIEPDGSVGPVREISATGSPVQAVADPLGRIAVLWRSGQRLLLTHIGPDGTPGEPHELAPPGDFEDSRFALDSLGRATVVWTGEQGTNYVRVAPDGTPGEVRNLTAGLTLGFPEVVVDSQDRATIVWNGTAASGFGPGPLQYVRVAADGAQGPIQEFGPQGGSRLMVVDSLDRVNMVYESGQDLRLRRIAPDGTLGDARTVGPSLSPARPTGLAIDPQDRIAVVGDGDHPQIPVRATRIAPDGTAAPVTSLPAGGKGSRVVIDSEGRATVVWHGPATFQPGFVELGPVHAVRIAADGTPGPLLTLSEGDDSPPAVTVEAETPQAPKDEVVVRAGCDEYCFLRAEGRLAIRRGRQARAVAKRLRLRRDEDVNFDGRSRNFITRSLRLGIKPEGRRVAIRALKRGHRVVAKVHVLAADPSGNISTDRVSVRLKRERG